MSKLPSLRAPRPVVELLENRTQPGSALTGLDPSILAGAFLDSNPFTGMLQPFGVADRQIIRHSNGSLPPPADTPVLPPLQSRLPHQPQTNQGMNTVFNPTPTDFLTVIPGLTALAGTQGGSDGEGEDPLTSSDVLYYGGACDHRYGLDNEFNTFIADAQTYDNFTVPAGHTWKVTGLFGHDYLNFTGVTKANWEIRQDITDGYGGTVIASGTADPAIQTPDGCNDFGLTSYLIRVFPQ